MQLYGVKKLNNKLYLAYSKWKVYSRGIANIVAYNTPGLCFVWKNKVFTK